MLAAAHDQPDDAGQQAEETSSNQTQGGAVSVHRPAGRSRLQKRASKLATTLSSWRPGHNPSAAQAAHENGTLPKQQHSTPQDHSTWLEVCITSQSGCHDFPHTPQVLSLQCSCDILILLNGQCYLLRQAHRSAASDISATSSIGTAGSYISLGTSQQRLPASGAADDTFLPGSTSFSGTGGSVSSGL
jgi:hypothetical protein